MTRTKNSKHSKHGNCSVSSKPSQARTRLPQNKQIQLAIQNGNDVDAEQCFLPLLLLMGLWGGSRAVRRGIGGFGGWGGSGGRSAGPGGFGGWGGLGGLGRGGGLFGGRSMMGRGFGGLGGGMMGMNPGPGSMWGAGRGWPMIF